MTDYERYIDGLLYQWGRWARTESVNLGFKIGVLGRIHGTTVKSPSISDDDALAIDRAVAMLMLDNPVYVDTAISRYVYNSTLREIAARIKKSHVTISNYQRVIITHVANTIPEHLSN